MITAKVIQHSSDFSDPFSDPYSEIITFELEYPRFIHSEFMTHRVFSRNAASSRAIPIGKMIHQVLESPAMPIHWGKNKSGMQADKEIANKDLAILEWLEASKSAAQHAKNLQDLGVHKQVVNRLLEPFQVIKVVVTATDWDNFYELRDHEDAQPEIRALARAMKEAVKESLPVELVAGEWHLPYIYTSYNGGKQVKYYLEKGGEELSEEDAIKISASCCAQVSYRLLNKDKSKALEIYDKLVNSKPIHASPFEHQAKYTGNTKRYRNFIGFIQNRHYIEKEELRKGCE